jgi:hypothetical protein
MEKREAEITITNFVDVMLEGGGMIGSSEKRTVTLSARIDPSDAWTWFPPELAASLGLVFRCERQEEKNGAVRVLRLYSEADITLAGRTVRVLVAEGAPGSHVKLGASILSALELRLDALTGELAIDEKPDNFLDLLDTTDISPEENSPDAFR